MTTPAILLTVLLASAADGRPDDLAFFEKHVRPVLAANCTSCHGAKGTPKGGLRLDTVAGLRKGGDSGPVLVAGSPEQSLLIRAVKYDGDVKMPPKSRLKDADVALLEQWVKRGAALPGATAEAATVALPAEGPIRSDHWAFQPIREPSVPRLEATFAIHNPIDRFLRAKLAARGMTPTPPADKRTLLRRATIDLIGLPPTPDEIDSFLNDPSPDAFARVVDRLLASPHYGERWGRHWLDVARYADSNGMDENLVHANAWRYRDYVLDALNRDLPFDQFVLEQLAGDLLPNPTSGQLIATGFLALGPKMLAEDDPVKMQMDIIDEQIDTVGKAFLGLTLGCARCHDHKFDPIPTTDYYALAGIFKSARVMDNYKVVARWFERPLGTPAEIEPVLTHRRKAEALKQAIAAFAKADPKADLRRPRDALKKLEAATPALAEAMGATESTVENVRVHLRGNHLTPGAEVPRRFPRVLAGDAQPPLSSAQSGRMELARWLVRRDNPLTARVIVNRVWHWHFGAGLVRSTDNFGLLGDRPAHPELLDWLTLRFLEDGWSLKALHRRIMLSATYQMSGGNDKEKDPENRLHARWSRQRLDAESLRDALLAVSGTLDRTMGGSLLQGANRGYVPGYPNGIYDRYDYPRRSVYLPVVRSMLYEVFQAFDFPDPSAPVGERASTTIAPQALFALNGKLMADQSRAFAQSLLDGPGSDGDRVARAYARAFGRPATSTETTRALDFTRQLEAEWARQGGEPSDRRLRAWQGLCRVLLSANEFTYVE